MRSYKKKPKHTQTSPPRMVTILPPKGRVKLQTSLSAPNEMVTVIPHTQNLPILIIGYTTKGRVEAVDVESHITLITHQLFIWILFTSTDMASTNSAGLVRVVLTSFTHRSILSCQQQETTGCFRLQGAPKYTGNSQRSHNYKCLGILRPLILTKPMSRISEG